MQKFKRPIKALFFIAFFFNAFVVPSQELKNYCGISTGPETGLALPKIGTYFFTKKNRYVGLDVSFWFIFSSWLSTNANVGLVKNNISYETGLSYWYSPEMDFGTGTKTGPSHHMSFNPKIGYQLKQLWIKIGPGFVFDKNYRNSGTALIDFTKFLGIRWNLEVLIKFNSFKLKENLPLNKP